MSVTDFLWVVLAVGGVWACWPRRRQHALTIPLSMSVHVRDMKISPGDWQRFCSLAATKGMKQPELVGEAVCYYLEQKIR